MVTYSRDQPCMGSTVSGRNAHDMSALLFDHLREEGFESMEVANRVHTERPDGHIS